MAGLPDPLAGLREGPQADPLAGLTATPPAAPLQPLTPEQEQANYGGNEFAKGLRRGSLGLLAGFEATAGQIAEPFSKTAADAMFAEANKSLAEAARSPARVPSWRGIRDLGSATDWAVAQMGEFAPQAALMGVGGAAGAGMKALGLRGVTSGLGAGATFVPPIMGETAQALHEDPAAQANTTPAERLALSAGVGGLGATAMTIPSWGALRRAAAPGVVERGIVPALGHIGGEAARTGVGLGIGSGITTAAQQAAQGYANPQRDTTQDWENIKESALGGGVSGAFLGGLTGAAGATVGMMRPKPAPPDRVILAGYKAHEAVDRAATWLNRKMDILINASVDQGVKQSLGWTDAKQHGLDLMLTHPEVGKNLAALDPVKQRAVIGALYAADEAPRLLFDENGKPNETYNQLKTALGGLSPEQARQYLKLKQVELASKVPEPEATPEQGIEPLINERQVERPYVDDQGNEVIGDTQQITGGREEALRGGLGRGQEPFKPATPEDLMPPVDITPTVEDVRKSVANWAYYKPDVESTTVMRPVMNKRTGEPYMENGRPKMEAVERQYTLPVRMRAEDNSITPQEILRAMGMPENMIESHIGKSKEGDYAIVPINPMSVAAQIQRDPAFRKNFPVPEGESGVSPKRAGDVFMNTMSSLFSTGFDMNGKRILVGPPKELPDSLVIRNYGGKREYTLGDYRKEDQFPIAPEPAELRAREAYMLPRHEALQAIPKGSELVKKHWKDLKDSINALGAQADGLEQVVKEAKEGSRKQKEAYKQLARVETQLEALKSMRQRIGKRFGELVNQQTEQLGRPLKDSEKWALWEHAMRQGSALSIRENRIEQIRHVADRMKENVDDVALGGGDIAAADIDKLTAYLTEDQPYKAWEDSYKDAKEVAGKYGITLPTPKQIDWMNKVAPELRDRMVQSLQYARSAADKAFDVATMKNEDAIGLDLTNSRPDVLQASDVSKNVAYGKLEAKPEPLTPEQIAGAKRTTVYPEGASGKEAKPIPEAPAKAPSNLEVTATKTPGYATRTNVNAKQSDVTIAFARDFNTAGERLTKKAAGEAYLPIPGGTSVEAAAQAIVKVMEQRGNKLNIAGNGIYTLKQHKVSQATMDKYVYDVLKRVHELRPIESIRSGGQTGVDEAGAKAGVALGIPTKVLMPAGYRYRDEFGKDHTHTAEEAAARFAAKPVAEKPAPAPEVKAPEERPRIMPMNYQDGTTYFGTKHEMRPEFAGKSTLDLIKSGDRTATTRFTKPEVKVGDVLRMQNKAGDYTDVRVTSEPYKVSTITPEEWSKLEGWKPELYDKYKQAWQFKYEQVNKPEAAKPAPKKIATIQEAAEEIKKVHFTDNFDTKVINDILDRIDTTSIPEAEAKSIPKIREMLAGIEDVGNGKHDAGGLAQATVDSWSKRFAGGETVRVAKLDKDFKGLLLLTQGQPLDAFGGMYLKINGNHYIITFEGGSRDKVTALGRLAHEFGHALQNIAFEKASPEVQAKLRAQYQEDLLAYSKDPKNIKRVISPLRVFDESVAHEIEPVAKRAVGLGHGEKIGKNLVDVSLEAFDRTLDASTIQYLTEFREWFAEQFSKYVTSRPEVAIHPELKPFWSKLYTQLKNFYNTIIKQFKPGETFETWVDSLVRPWEEKKVAAPKPESVLTYIAGDRYRVDVPPGHPEHGKQVSAMRKGRLGMDVELVREPTNKFDPNAIKVMIGDKQHGYVPAVEAKKLAPYMDAGGKLTGTIDKRGRLLIAPDENVHVSKTPEGSLVQEVSHPEATPSGTESKKMTPSVAVPPAGVEGKLTTVETPKSSKSEQVANNLEPKIGTAKTDSTTPPPTPEAKTEPSASAAEAIKNPTSPAANQYIYDLNKKLFGRKVEVVFGEPPKGVKTVQIAGGRGYYAGRQQLDKFKANEAEIAKVRNERRMALDAGNTAAVERLNKREAELLKQNEVLGTIYLNPRLADREQLPTYYHESVHAAFDVLLNPEERAIIGTAFSRGLVRQQLEKIFKDDPEALAQIRGNAEEAAAYGFQVYATAPHLISLGAKATTVFGKVKEWFRKMLNILTPEEKAAIILNDMLSGRRAETGLSPLQRRLDKDMTLKETIARHAKEVGKVVVGFWEKIGTGDYDRLAGMDNPAIKQIADLGATKTGSEEKLGMIHKQRAENDKQMNIISKLTKRYTPEELKAAIDARVDGTKAPSGKAGDAYNDLQKFFDGFYAYAKKAGVDIGYTPNYWPMLWDAEAVMKNRDAFLQMISQQKYAEHLDKLKVTPTELWENISGYVTRGESFQNIMGKAGEPVNAFAREKSLNFLDAADRRPFMEKNALITLVHYVDQMTRQAEYVRAFGSKGEKFWKLLGEAENKYGATPDQIALTKDYIDGLLGNREVGMSRELKDIYGAIAVYQNYRLLPFNLFSSLVDPLGVAVRSNRLMDAFDTFAYSAKNLFRDLKKNRPDWTKDDWEKLSEDWGLIQDAGTVENLRHMSETTQLRGWTRTMNDALFKWNLLNGWTRSNKIMAVKAAQRLILRSAEGKSEIDARYLKELGLDKSDVIIKGKDFLRHKEQLIQHGLSPEQAEAIEGRLRDATIKFVDQSILNPSAADLPNWGSNPYFAPLFHLKQFMFSFQSVIIDRIINEAKQGNFTPLWVGTIYVPGMIAADAMKGLILNMGSMPAYQQNWGVVDYLNNGIERSGLTGTAQMLLSMKDDVMHGGRGYESAVGPMVEQILDALKATTKGGDKLFNFTVKSIPGHQIADHWLIHQQPAPKSDVSPAWGFVDDAAVLLARG